MQIIVQTDADIGGLSDPTRIEGRLVVNTEWVVAYLQWGQADSLTLIIQEAAQAQAVERELHRYGLYSYNCPLKFCLATELPELLRSLPRPIFFRGDPLIGSVKRSMRHIDPHRSIPVTGLTHTLSTEKIIRGGQALLLEHFDACDAIVCTSRAAREFLHQVWEYKAAETKLKVPDLLTPQIPLGIFPERYQQFDDKFAETLPKNRPLVLIHGRISLLDKMDLLSPIEKWPEITSRVDSHPYLVISGSKGHAGTLDIYKRRIAELRMSEDILIMPNLSDAQRSTLYQQAQIYCSLSDNLQETFGISVIEAMAAQCPVILSDWNGYKDLIIDGQEGYFIPTYWGVADQRWSGLGPLISDNQRALYLAQQVSVDMNLFADRLVHLLRNPELCNEIGQKGKARVDQKYTWSKVINLYDNLFQQQCDAADKLSPLDTPSRPPGLWSFFGHYCGQEITTETRVRLTAKGEAILSGRTQAFIFLDQPWHREALEKVSFSNDPAGKPVHELLTAVDSESWQQEDAFSAILWMLKRDWLAVCK